jgi:hypothetical protein
MIFFDIVFVKILNVSPRIKFRIHNLIFKKLTGKCNFDQASYFFLYLLEYIIINKFYQI